MSVAKGIVAAALVVAALATSCSGRQSAGLPALAPGHFVADANAAFSGPLGIVTVDARTGRTQNLHLHLTPASDKLRVRGLAVDGGGNLWVTRASGPVCTNNDADCGVKPHSCAGQIERVDKTGTSHVFYRATPDERIEGVSPSPSMHDIAFLVGPCEQFGDEHIRVQHLGGAAFDIGAGVIRCHVLGAPQWLSDGTHLAALYQPPAAPASVRDAGPACPPWQPGGVIIVAAAPATDLPAPTIFDPNCPPNAVAAKGDRVAVVLSCGTSEEGLDGPGKLVVTDPSLHDRKVSTIGECVNGASAAVDHAGDIAVSTYQFCSRVGESPHTLVFVGSGTPRQVRDFPGGTLALDNLAW